VLRTVFLLFAAATLLQADETAYKLFQTGRTLEKAGEFTRAYVYYAQASALEPKNKEFRGRAEALQSRANATVTPSQPVPDGGDDPALDDPISEYDLREAREMRPPPRLNAKPGKQSFDLAADPRKLFEMVGRGFGIAVLFDQDYPTDGAGKQVRFKVDDVDYREALRMLEIATNSFIVVRNSSLMLIAKDTQQKRVELEPNVSLIVNLPETVSAQEIQELARSVQQAMEIQKFQVDNTRKIALMRDRVSKVAPAQQLFRQLLFHRPMVEIEVEVVNFSQTGTNNYGTNLQDKASLVDFGRIWNSTVPAAAANTVTFGGGKTYTGVGISSAEVFATMTKAWGQSVMTSQMMTVAGQPVTFHVGDRFPILTSGYFGTVTGNTGNGIVYSPPPSFQFEDLGVSIKVTPQVHGIDEMTLDIEAEFKLLSGTALNGIPIISNRKFNSKVRIRNGEWAIMAGLAVSSDALTLGGPWGLSQLPLLGKFFRNNNRELSENNTMLVLKPHLLSLPASEQPVKQFYVGTESRLPTVL
jgi:general secretion pathway protein D